MPTPVLPLAVLLIGLSGPRGTPAELPAPGVVVADRLGAYLEPDRAAVATGRLARGEAVRVVDAEPGSGWLTIEAPGEAFAWVAREAVGVGPDGSGRVRDGGATLRAGVPGARLPGPPVVELRAGAAVRLLDRPPLVTGATTWLAVAPPEGDVRYVRAEGVRVEAPLPPPPPERHGPPREVRAAFEPSPFGADAAEVAAIEAEHRAALDPPVDRWQLAPVRSHYEALLKRTTDPAAARALRGRLDLVARHESVARSARTFETILQRSRRRDGRVAMTMRAVADLDRPRRGGFLAEGLVQPSSRQVDGRRVYALIGSDGAPVAYLDVPPGLDARSVISRRAGVRGSVRYDENLNARLIAVRDLEPLD